jgi:hypothetical protein
MEQKEVPCTSNNQPSLRGARTYTRCEFETFEDLEQYFVNEILGCTDVRSKVIGKVLIWAKEAKQ